MPIRAVLFDESMSSDAEPHGRGVVPIEIVGWDRYRDAMAITRTRRSCCLIVAGLAMLAACNGDDDATSATVTPPTATPSTRDTAPSTTASPTTSTAPTTSPDTSDEATTTSSSSPPTTSDASSTTAPTTAPTDTDQAAAETAWTELLTATADPGADTNGLDQIATPAMVDQMTTFFRLAGPDGVDVTTFPSATVNGGGTATIEDCIWHSPDVSDDPSFHFTATAQPIDTGYQITGITPQGPGCVPKELAEPALAAYAEFREVTVDLGRNPDPDDPRLQQVASGPTLESFRTAATDLATNGYTLWLGGESNPYPFEFPRPDTIVVDDCILPEDGFGEHDETGAPTGELAIEPGKQPLQVITMVLTDGGWKADNGNILTDFQCDPESLPVLTVVGG